MSDVMLFGVLKMPYEMAMSSELSRLQFYQRVQQLVARVEAQPEQEPDMLTIAYMSGLYEGRKLEREACAKVCEDYGKSCVNEWNKNLGVADDLLETAEECAEAIRARRDA